MNTYTVTDIHSEQDWFVVTLVRNGVEVAEVECDLRSMDYNYTWINQEEEVLFDAFSGKLGMDDMVDKLIG